MDLSDSLNQTAKTLPSPPAGWHCVHIEQTRLINAFDATFRNMLKTEYRALGEPDGCEVYRRTDSRSGYWYFFSPKAAEAMKAFAYFWKAFGCEPPASFEDLETII